MDPASIIGVSGTALEVAGSICKVIKTVNELRVQYRRADTTLTLLEIQLNTLKQTANRISKWKESNCTAQLSLSRIRVLLYRASLS